MDEHREGFLDEIILWDIISTKKALKGGGGLLRIPKEIWLRLAPALRQRRIQSGKFRTTSRIWKKHKCVGGISENPL
jgi:hypothetical protein